MTLADGDRGLVKDLPAAAEHGIYVAKSGDGCGLGTPLPALRGAAGLCVVVGRARVNAAWVGAGGRWGCGTGC